MRWDSWMACWGESTCFLLNLRWRLRHRIISLLINEFERILGLVLFLLYKIDLSITSCADLFHNVVVKGRIITFEKIRVIN
jgi:hypothetical protein